MSSFFFGTKVPTELRNVPRSNLGRFPQFECPADRVGLVADRAKFVTVPGKAEDVNRIVARPEKIESSAHRTPGAYKFEIEDRASKSAGEVLVLARNISGKELQLVLFAANDVAEDSSIRDLQSTNLKMAVVAIDKYVLHIRAGRRGLDSQLPSLVRDLETIINVRIIEARDLCGRLQRQSADQYRKENEYSV